MKKLALVAAIALPLFTAGYASAGEPMRLTDGQMDRIAAGGLSVQTLYQSATVFGGKYASTYVSGHAHTLQVGAIGSGTSTLRIDLAGIKGVTQGSN